MSNRASTSPDAACGPRETSLLGLLRRRPLLIPTWRGWLLLALSAALLLVWIILGAHRFLAVNDPQPGGALVVEGWAPDYALERVVDEFKRHHYDRLYVTGIPLDTGSFLSEYKTFAELGAATLGKLGLGTNVVQAVPAPAVRQDRTYASALALRHWLAAQRLHLTKFTLVTVGPHARRSRLMFEKAMGKGVTVGVIAIPAHDYDEAHWWRYSQGVRNVIGEALAYVYARFLFYPGPQPSPD